MTNKAPTFPRFAHKQNCESCGARLDLVKERGCGAPHGQMRETCNEESWGSIKEKATVK